MKKEVRQLRGKAISALVLSIEHFNRPWDFGRVQAVLILMDHSFEMLLKAAIRHRGGRIRARGARQTIGFTACVRRAHSDASLQFLDAEQVLTLQAINGLRNATHHYLVDVSEHELYFYTQAGVTLFRDVHDEVFDTKLVLELPERVLPVSTTAPKDLSTLFDTQIEEIRCLLAPGTRKKMDAIAKLRSLAVLESAVNGDYEQPSDSELKKACDRLSQGSEWTSLFPGVASINIGPDHEGLALNLRLTKNKGIPVQLLAESSDSTAVVAVRRVNELDYYSLSPTQLAEKLDLTPPKSRALVDQLGLRDDPKCFKEIKVGKVKHARYSPAALEPMRAALDVESIEDVWIRYREGRSQ